MSKLTKMLGRVAISAEVAVIWALVAGYVLLDINKVKNLKPKEPASIERTIDEEVRRFPYVDKNNGGLYPETLEENYRYPDFKPEITPPVKEKKSNEKGPGVPWDLIIPEHEMQEWGLV